VFHKETVKGAVSPPFHRFTEKMKGRHLFKKGGHLFKKRLSVLGKTLRRFVPNVPTFLFV
jgi:hypothetical protein